MQNGQPVAYVLHALTSAETQYAQIEKELLAIVFACHHFEASLSTLVLNSRDQHENLWLPQKMCLENNLTTALSFSMLPYNLLVRCH